MEILINTVTGIVRIVGASKVVEDNLQTPEAAPTPPAKSPEKRERLEILPAKELFRMALQKAHGNKSLLARELGFSRATIIKYDDDSDGTNIGFRGKNRIIRYLKKGDSAPPKPDYAVKTRFLDLSPKAPQVLRDALIKAGSTHELARVIGVHPSAIGFWRHGKGISEPNLHKLSRYAYGNAKTKNEKSDAIF